MNITDVSRQQVLVVKTDGDCGDLVRLPDGEWLEEIGLSLEMLGKRPDLDRDVNLWLADHGRPRIILEVAADDVLVINGIVYVGEMYTLLAYDHGVGAVMGFCVRRNGSDDEPERNGGIDDGPSDQ
jgi:hypothetical protein